MNETNDDAAAGSHAPVTARPEYAQRLATLGTRRWKRLLDVQRPYRWNLRRNTEGQVLEVGCGVGRNLAHLAGRAVGVDHNANAVAVCRRRGLNAYLPAQFHSEMRCAARSFDTLLLAHVVEHMHRAEAVALISEYLPYLRPNGLLLMICPQEAGFASDPTHVEFLDQRDLAELARMVGARVQRTSSFPFPRAVGRVFRYNESVVSARSPA